MINKKKKRAAEARKRRREENERWLKIIRKEMKRNMRKWWNEKQKYEDWGKKRRYEWSKKKSQLTGKVNEYWNYWMNEWGKNIWVNGEKRKEIPNVSK